MQKLTQAEIDNALSKLTGWKQQENSLVKVFTFADFVAAFAFMTKVAIEAEKLNHHPDWCNVYNQVKIALSTHDVGGLSTRDIHLAETIDNLR